MILIPHIHPHPRWVRLPPAQHGHSSLIGGHDMRFPHLRGHPLIQRLGQIGYIAAPDRLRGPRDLKSLPGKDVFQPIEGHVISELAGHNVGQQSRSGQALVDRRVRLGRDFDLWVVALLLAGRTGIFLAYMLNALETARNVVDLPAFLGADLLALLATAGACPLFRLQFMDMGSKRKIFKIGKLATSFPFLDSAQLVFRFGLTVGLTRKIVRMDGFLLQLQSEVQERLRQLLFALQPVGARSAVQLLELHQFFLQLQIFDIELVGSLLLAQILKMELVGPLLLAIPFTHQGPQQRLQRFAIFGKLRQLRFGRHTL